MKAKIFFGRAVLWAALASCGCASSVGIREVAPVLTPPSHTELPEVTVPAPSADGYYCFGREDVLKIRNGIKDLKAENKALREILEKYEQWRTGWNR